MGFMLGPAIGGFLFPRLGYTLSIYPAAILAFVTAILAFWVLKPWMSNVEREQIKILPTIVEDEAFEEEEAGGQELGIVTEAQHEGEPIPWVSRSTW
jgi:MFS family permease